MQTNNKMREALTQIEAMASARCAWDIATIAKTALAAPARNCDVGTAEEQSRRFDEFCSTRVRGCSDCPLVVNRCCKLGWAQMTYEKGGDK